MSILKSDAVGLAFSARATSRVTPAQLDESLPHLDDETSATAGPPLALVLDEAVRVARQNPEDPHSFVPPFLPSLADAVRPTVASSTSRRLIKTQSGSADWSCNCCSPLISTE
jgi:hypothetical protein